MTASEWRAILAVADKTYEGTKAAYRFNAGSYTFDAMQASGFLQSKIAERAREAIFIEAWAEYCSEGANHDRK